MPVSIANCPDLLSLPIFGTLLILACTFVIQTTPSRALAKERPNADRWVGTWSAAALNGYVGMFGNSRFANEGFENQTVRMIVRASIGGHRVRVRLSNEFGTNPLVIGSARIAICKSGPAIVFGTDRVLTFGGATSIAIPAGTVLVSDPIDLDVPELAELAVSVFASGKTGPATWHPWGHHASYISRAGDFTAAVDMPYVETRRSWYWLTGVDVFAPHGTGAIVVLGDSITEGDEGGEIIPQPYGGWVDVLARRLVNEPGNLAPMAVLNEGIAGNRLLHDFIGASALSRLQRDGLDQDGVQSIVIQEGMNDIGLPAVPLFSAHAKETVTAVEIIAGLRQIVERAHAKGIKVFVCTLIPMGGSAYGSAEIEAKREAVNHWIRTSDEVDGVLDFDAVLRDPTDPKRILPTYDPGDHMHANGPGYEAMGDAVDLTLFRTPPPSK